jgi:hypothetical protein
MDAVKRRKMITKRPSAATKKAQREVGAALYRQQIGHTSREDRIALNVMRFANGLPPVCIVCGLIKEGGLTVKMGEHYCSEHRP